ncbi:four-helix bundle copper-binding protein [Kocuria aegyptia]|uniref:Four-helix bundle copper-binding protein n=1 Tax=Kocuria aegyptia TaxID=330943 RepID=A0ABP4WL01_9MICC
MEEVKLTARIAACFECAPTCTAGADARPSEDTVAELAQCIRTSLDSADLCATTGNVLSRHTGYDGSINLAVLRACWMVAKACAEECETLADRHEHCRICAEAYCRCEVACADLITALG